MTLLSHAEATLPSAWYYDPGHYRAELEAIWYRDWVCVGRLDDIPETGDYFLAEIGSQRLVVTRNGDGQPRAFHNTCRHRGSTLCTAERGRFPNGRILCPYHAWAYGLNGDLVATPRRIPTDDFRAADFSLYRAHTGTWGGFVFVNLADEPATSLEEFLAPEAAILANWPLADMVSVHRESRVLACNWKIFWENYSECYHCPRVHPELCRVVPVYREGVISYADAPGWTPTHDGDAGRPAVAPGMTTWTMNGQSVLPLLDGPTEKDRAPGMQFASFTASMFVVGHPDYVRSVRMLPRGPESAELIVDWLLPPAVAESHRDAIESVVEFGRLVVEQDGAVCELNQKGLKSPRHAQGVLIPQEYYLWEFHEWLRQRLDAGQ